MNRVVCAASTTHKRAQQSHEHRNAANRLAPIRSIRDRIRIPAARFRHFTENISLAAPSVVGAASAAPGPEPQRYDEPRRDEPRYQEPRYEERRDDRPRYDDRDRDRYRDERSYQDYKRKKKRKSFLEDIFDFD